MNMNKYLFVGLVLTVVLLFPSLFMFTMIGDVYVTNRAANIEEIEAGSGPWIEKRIEITPVTFLAFIGLVLLFVGLAMFFLYAERWEKKVGLKHG